MGGVTNKLGGAIGGKKPLEIKKPAVKSCEPDPDDCDYKEPEKKDGGSDDDMDQDKDRGSEDETKVGTSAESPTAKTPVVKKVSPPKPAAIASKPAIGGLAGGIKRKPLGGALGGALGGGGGNKFGGGMSDEMKKRLFG